jgi:hypothetical protein
VKSKIYAMKKVILLLFIFMLATTFQQVSAQNETDSALIRIETRDGNEYVGRLVSQDADKVILLTENLGEISILTKDIVAQKEILPDQVKDGEIWFPNPQATRYFWAPNGYGLKKGEGYYQNIWVLWNQFAYGITDNFSIGATVIPLFLFGGGPTPVFINPKISFPLEKNKFNLGAGALAGTVLGESDATFGILYGVSTFGTPDNNVSIGLGYGFAGGEWATTPLINFCGMFRLSSRWYFLSENYYIGLGDGGGGIISAGARWIIKKAAVDFGLFMPVGADAGLIAIPWLGFTVPFGNTH